MMTSWECVFTPLGVTRDHKAERMFDWKNYSEEICYICHAGIMYMNWSWTFQHCLGPEKVQIFQRLWSNIDQQNFKPSGVPVDPRRDEPQVQELRNETIVFIQSVLLSNTGYMPREDYREMIELCLLILGVLPVEGNGSGSGTYHFRLPGAYHLARWMAKVIYCFKIYLFR